MNKMRIPIQPFLIKQVIYIYDDNDMKVDAIPINLTNLIDKVLEVANQYNIIEVEFIGPQTFTKGIGNKILEKELEKYSVNKLIITYKG